MKKVFFPLFLSGLLLLPTGCGRKDAPTTQVPADTLRFDSVTIDTVVAIEGFGTQSSPEGKISLNIKYAQGANAQRVNDTILCHVLRSAYVKPDGSIHSVPQATQAFARAHALVYKREVLRMLPLFKGMNAATASSEYIEETEVQTGLPGTVNYVIGRYEYTGGAHGLSYQQGLVFQVESGKRILLSDLFGADYERKLLPLFVEYLCKQQKVSNLEELKKTGFFHLQSPYIPNNFILRPDALVLLFNQGEIAAMSEGAIAVALPFDKVAPLLVTE